MSIVSVDNIQPIGSGTSVTVNSAATLVLNNANSTGVITATSFSGSGANLTSLPAANLTGTLPAISGANLTSLPSQVTINSAGSNRLITSDSGTTLNGESSLTYDGTTLQAITSLSGTREQLNLKNQNASAGTSRINFFSTVSGTEFACAAIRNGVNTLNQGRLFLQTNKGSGLTNSLELDQSGNATITDGNLIFASGHGIDFSATANSGGSMSSELLDDYEEGSFSPAFNTTANNLTFNGGSRTNASLYQSRKGSYVKIGKRVWFQISMSTTGLTSVGGSDFIGLDGLPFTSENDSNRPRFVMACMGGRFNGFVPLFPVLNPGTTLCQLRESFDVQRTINYFDTGGGTNRNVIEAFGSYEVA